MPVKSLSEARDADPMGLPVVLAEYECDCIDGSGICTVKVYKGRWSQDEVGTDEIKACCHLEDGQPCSRYEEFIKRYIEEAKSQEAEAGSE